MWNNIKDVSPERSDYYTVWIKSISGYEMFDTWQFIKPISESGFWLWGDDFSIVYKETDIELKLWFAVPLPEHIVAQGYKDN